MLLQAGVGVNAADLKGLTPLMTACMYGKTATGNEQQNCLNDFLATKCNLKFLF